MENEVWKPIKGFEGYYEVSSMGRIKSLERVIIKSNGAKLNVKETILKPAPTLGYLGVHICRDGIKKMAFIHRVVANTFLDYPLNSKEIIVADHINGITTDNRLENLRFVTTRFNSTMGMRKNKRIARSKFIGVSYVTCRKKWKAEICINGYRKYLGTYKTDIEASIAYQNALSKTLL